MAKLIFRYGAMNCGKTTYILQAMHNYESRGQKVFLMKSKIDTKGGSSIVNRLGLERKVDLLFETTENLFSYIKQQEKDLACIFVDEAQFLKKEQVDELQRVTYELDIPVICYGIRTDFQKNGFEGSRRLLEIAHTIEELKTVCECGKKAIFNARKVNGKFVKNGNKVEIDNQKEIEYVTFCAKCYHKKVGEED